MKLSVSKRNLPIQKIDLGKDVVSSDHSETIFLIGRSKDCHVVLDDKQVSREHVRILFKRGQWFVEKVSQENVCLLNGESIANRELKDGDSLTIGQFNIMVESISVNENTIKDEMNISEPNVENNSGEDANVFSEKDASFSFNDDIDKKTENLVAATTKPNIREEEELVDFSEVTTDFNLQEDFKADFKEDSKEIEKNSSVNISEFKETTENDVELALGLNSEESSASADVVQAEEPATYSLENIDNAEDENTKVIQSFSKVQLELFGETAPYDKYLIEKDKTYIGRDPSKCQIVLNDPDVSSVHAVLVKNNIMVSLEDLKSSNGTLLNGDRINKSILAHNDEFIIGAVTFTVKFRSDFLKEENARLMAVDENQTVEVEEIVEVQAEEGESVDALGEIVKEAPPEKSILKRIWKDDKKRKNLVYVLVAIALVWNILPEDKPSAPEVKKTTSIKKNSDDKNKPKAGSSKKLSEEEQSSLSAIYALGKNHFNFGRYREALDEFSKISAVDPNFNSSLQSLIALSKEGLGKLEDQERKRIAEQNTAEKRQKVKELVSKASSYVKERRVDLAQDTFNEIAKLDPENIEITKLKLELEDYQKEKARKELEESSRKKAREDKIEKLKPGKTLYLQKEWFKAIGKLDDFLKIKDMDEDLIKEASEMLKTSKDEVSSGVAPLIGKAKSLMEGQDLKGAYEVYQQILKIEPSNSEALNQVVEIKDQLNTKARKIYREAIISESLSLFQDAKEKFQEVQQISPIDSDYYKKATDKLKDYLE